MDFSRLVISSLLCCCDLHSASQQTSRQPRRRTAASAPTCSSSGGGCGCMACCPTRFSPPLLAPCPAYSAPRHPSAPKQATQQAASKGASPLLAPGPACNEPRQTPPRTPPCIWSGRGWIGVHMETEARRGGSAPGRMAPRTTRCVWNRWAGRLCGFKPVRLLLLLLRFDCVCTAGCGGHTALPGLAQLHHATPLAIFTKAVQVGGGRHGVKQATAAHRRAWALVDPGLGFNRLQPRAVGY